ncbi:hypothetical protein HDU76_008151 [Blyttiomyces sp. JEL0837]|nr:hypothetical protein HDU76_008151 [Blyttiomyces sp. JEL0837]
MSNLISISLKDNELTGPIPTSLGNASKLIDINLSGNSLSGPVPDSLTKLQSVSFLELSRNSLSGSLPESLGKMSNLSYLFISNTNISGSLPVSLANLKKLRSIGLWNNYIDGAIPDAYGNISTLRSLSIQSNLISGQVPLSFANMSELSMDVSDNCLSPNFAMEVQNNKHPQKLVCEKFPSHNSAAKTIPSSLLTPPPSLSSASGVPVNQQDERLTVFSTFTLSVVTVSNSPQPSSPIPQDGHSQNTSNVKLIAAVATTSVVSLTIIFALAWFFRRREDRKSNEASTEATPAESNINQSEHHWISEGAAFPELNLEPEVSPTVQWLSELHPATQQSLFEKNSNPTSNVNTDATNSTSQKSKQTPNGSVTDSNAQQQQQQSQAVDEKFYQEIDPNLQSSLYSAIVSESAPTSNINLENHLQRLYGSYTLWTYEFVMEWARLKKLDSEEWVIFHYRIDGQLLSTLDVHSLKDKCDVQDFRLRAKFMQAVEFLKDSHRVVANSAAIANSTEESLPEYAGAVDSNV